MAINIFLAQKPLIMNKLLTITLLFLAIFLINNKSYSQAVEESERAMSKGLNNALIVHIPNASAKVADKVWKKYSKDFKGKTKKDRKSNEWFTDDGKITGIGGSNTIDIYTQISENGDAVSMSAWFDLGGAFLSSFDHADAYNSAYDMLLDYAREVGKEMTEIELKNEEKELKHLDGELKKLAKAKEGYERDIENAKERIRQAEQNIENNLVEQDNTIKAIDQQKEVIEGVKVKLSEF